MKYIPAIILAVTLCSCAYVDYKPYEGADSSGPISSGTFVERGYSLPIYQGFPPRPYRVIGLINASDRAMSIEGVDHAAVRAAKANGADAVLLLGKDSVYGGTQSGGGFSANTAWSSQGEATYNPHSRSVYGTAQGTSNTSGYSSGWTRPIWLQQGQFVAIKWLN